jgi:tetratricopeptide (TPR) repeat protein
MSTAYDLMGWRSLVSRYAGLAAQYSGYVDPQRPILQVDWSRAFHYNIHADYEKSIEHASRVAEIARSTGDLRFWGSGMDLTAWAQLSQGNLSESLETSQKVIEVAKEGSDQQLLCWGLLGLGVTMKRLGQIDQAISNLEQATQVSEKVPDYHTLVAANAWLGRCLIAIGEIDKAIILLEASQEVLSGQGIVLEIPILGNGLSEAYLAHAERSSGKERQQWLKKAKNSCQETLKTAKRYRPPMADALLFQGRLKWLLGDTAAAEVWWEKALEESRQTRDLYAEGVIHSELGRRLGDGKHLQRAIAILEEINAEFDLAGARKAFQNLQND